MGKVLIIDDNQDFLELMLMALGKTYECTGFSTLSEMDSYLENNSFDILVSDYNIGAVSALELIDRLLKKGSLRKQPVLIVSGTELHVTDKIPVQYYFLEKPFRLAEFKEKIKEIMESRKEILTD